VDRFARLVGIALVALSLAAGAVAVAGPGGGNSGGNSGTVKPGKGCGDKNHYHQRESECKKPPK
jgi:hypothetical protein